MDVKASDSEFSNCWNIASDKTGHYQVEHNLQEDLVHLGDYSEVVPAATCTGMPGVLRYTRESQHQATDPNNIDPMALYASGSPVMCEYCGEKNSPPLHFVAWTDGPMIFCCAQYQQLCEMLQNERQLALDKSHQEKSDAVAAVDTEAQTINQEHDRLWTAQENLPKYAPSDNYCPPSKTLRYQLSTCPPREKWTVTPTTDHRMDFNVGDVGDDKEGVPFYDNESFQFGICHQQDLTKCQQKYFSHGIKFLTLFPDGSAQLFYPSGLLALAIIVVKGKGRVCVVYEDDTHAAEQPTRALFQSDGKATCYHGNGNIWLSLVQSGGQCLDEAGSRVRRWSWSGQGKTPTPLRPVFISLNPSIGVRIFGQGQVYVSFLASGQQAKFNVGCCGQSVGNRRPRLVEGPSISKEELFLLAGKMKAHLTIKQLRLFLETPSNPRPVREQLAPRFFSVAQRLLDLSHSVEMRPNETAFIQKSLHDCLSCSSG